ncbi:DUF4382 domain-containing protein [Myxococcota bacterium]|nr:DUF4382 domain-containing protein [Myxococcota bacterium]
MQSGRIRSRGTFGHTAFICCLSLGLIASAGCQIETQEPLESGVVNVVITDAPTDDLQAAQVTLTEISLVGDGSESVTLFSGRETFDLLALRDASEIFAMAKGIPPGHYRAIRLKLAEEGIELFETNELARHFPELPLNNTFTVGLEPSFHVRSQASHVLEIDFDLDQSIQWNESGPPSFRPIIKVQSIEAVIDGKLTRLQGYIEAFDLDGQTLSLCRLRRPLAWRDDRKAHGVLPQSSDHRLSSIEFQATDSVETWAQEKNNDANHPWRRCVEVALSSHTSLFDPDGSPILPDSLEVNSPATVIGRIGPSNQGDFVMMGAFVALGEGAVFSRQRGWAIGGITQHDDFLMEPVAGRDELVVQLFPSTQFFERSGWPISPGVVQPGMPVSATGVIFSAPDRIPVMAAAFLVVDVTDPDQAPLQGQVESVESNERGVECPLILDLDGFRVGVTLEANARITRIESIHGIAEPIRLEELRPDERIEVYGHPGETAEACYRANSILAFAMGSPTSGQLNAP